MDTCNIFYSWQSDIKDSRNFISDCLKRLPKKLRELSVIEIDRDTAGITGSPNIGDTIYKKIDHCDIFVADVTIINADEKGRKTPNPNVMIELGYAIKALGWDRIILLYNKDYGDVEKLPFDINHQRMTSYSFIEEKKPEAREKIITSFAITIEILKSKGILHGGNPLLSTARKDFAGTLYEAMKRIYRYYDGRYCQKQGERYTDFLVITDAQFDKLDILRSYLDEEKYFELAVLLQKLRMAGTGADDANGQEYADEISNEYFEPLFREYGTQINLLLLEQVLTRKFIELYNAVIGEEQLVWKDERKIDSGGWLEEESQKYYFADVAVEDGEMRIVKETLKPFRSLYLYSDMMGI